MTIQKRYCTACKKSYVVGGWDKTTCLRCNTTLLAPAVNAVQQGRANAA